MGLRYKGSRMLSQTQGRWAEYHMLILFHVLVMGFVKVSDISC